MHRFRSDGLRCFVIAVIVLLGGARADEPEEASLADRRLELMRRWTQDLVFRAGIADFPTQLEAEPLFRYDDLTRGYVDGAIWRLGAAGRPRALVTTELNPDYYGSGPRIVYEFLSLTDVPLTARSTDVAGWTPPGSGLATGSLPNGPAPAAAKPRRLFQMKQMAGRFSATQDVDGEHLQLRLLPRPIDRYVPGDGERADAALFLFVSGRMPGVILLLETDGSDWTYGVGRLSGPSTLTLSLDGEVVWQVEPASYGWDQPYTASNSSAVIPGFE